MMNQDELNEALSLAKKMKNALKAFEDIEKLIQAQAAIQGLQSDLEAKTKFLQAQLAGLPAKLSAEQAEFGDKINKIDADLAKAREGASAELDRISAKKADAQAELNVEMSRLAAVRVSMADQNATDIAKMKQALADATTAHAKAMVTLSSEEKSKRSTLAALQTEIDALKQKFA